MVAPYQGVRDQSGVTRNDMREPKVEAPTFAIRELLKWQLRVIRDELTCRRDLPVLLNERKC